MSTKPLNISPGWIVEYLQNNQPVIAWVLEIQNQKARLLNINKREIKLPLSRLLPWSGPSYTASSPRDSILSALAEHSNSREKLREELDVLEVWSLSQGEIDKAPVYWFSDLLWPQWEEDRLAALGRAMLQAKNHFKFVPPDFEVFTQEVVDRRLEEARLQQEKKRLISEGNQFFRSLWSGKGVDKEPADQELRDRLQKILLEKISDPESCPDVSWDELTAGLPRDQHLPFLLARLWGVVPWHYNFHLDQADYVCGETWTREFRDNIREIQDVFEAAEKEPVKQGFVSVDSASTWDIDDAFLLLPRKEGFLLRLAFACPPLAWPFESPLDEAVMHRASSLYLPEGNCHMLPPELGTDTFSLHCGEKRPALVFDLYISEQGELQEIIPCFSWVQVEENITYAEAEDRIEKETHLSRANHLARLLRQNRVKQGAIVIEQPDPEIRLFSAGKDTRVELVDSGQFPEAQVTVSEFMIMANAAIGRWAIEQDIPLMFRTQDIVLPDGGAGVWTDPVNVFQLVRSMGATVTEAVPRPHKCLGVSSYAPITSPLRRYVDMINSKQVYAALSGDKPAWTKEELESRLKFLNSRINAVSKVQRYRPRYWKLLYFRQNRDKAFSGVVVDNSGKMVTLALPREKIMVKGPESIFAGNVREGQRFSVRFGKVDPLHNEIKVSEAWEE